MMASVNTAGGVMLKFDTPDSVSDKFGIDRPAINRAQIRAINKVGRWFKASLARYISKSSNIKQSYIKRRLYMRNAQGSNTAAALWAGMYDMNLIMQGKGRKSGTGRTVKGKFIHGGFLAEMNSGHQGIFTRKGPSRLPIQEEKVKLQSDIENAVNRLMNQAEARFSQVLRQELNYEMQKMMKADK